MNMDQFTVTPRDNARPHTLSREYLHVAFLVSILDEMLRGDEASVSVTVTSTVVECGRSLNVALLVAVEITFVPAKYVAVME